MTQEPKTLQGYSLLHHGAKALARAEQQGMRIDVEYCERKQEELTEKITALEQELYQTNFYRRWQHIANNKVNINSNEQLGNYLYNHRKVTPIKYTATGKGSTDEEALAQLNIPELNVILKIRGLRKVRDTYLKAYVREQVNGYIHPFFNLHTVRTFRSSSDRPNFQNIPKRDKETMRLCRKAIYPRPGHQLLAVDFGALEVRIAACYHKDPTMMKYIKDPTTDMHGDMAKQIFMIDEFNRKIPEHSHLRSAVKNGFVFPQFYGDYYKNCAKSMAGTWCKLPETKWKKGQGVDLPDGKLSDHLIAQGIKSFDQFVEHIREIEYDFWNRRFPVYQKWKDNWWKEYQKRGYIEMLTGFRCSGLISKNDCINYPVQGSAFHCLLWCLIRMDELIQERGWKTRLVGQIHDEMILDVYPPELDEVLKVAKEVACEELPKVWDWIIVPLEVEAELGGVDASWADLRPI